MLRLSVNQRQLGFKLGGALLRQDIQDEFDRSIRAIVNADMCHCKNLGFTIRIAEKITIIDYVINRNPIA